MMIIKRIQCWYDDPDFAGVMMADFTTEHEPSRVFIPKHSNRDTIEKLMRSQFLSGMTVIPLFTKEGM